MQARSWNHEVKSYGVGSPDQLVYKGAGSSIGPIQTGKTLASRVRLATPSQSRGQCVSDVSDVSQLRFPG